MDIAHGFVLNGYSEFVGAALPRPSLIEWNRVAAEPLLQGGDIV